MENIKKSLAIVLAAIVACSLSACGGIFENSDKTLDDNLNLSMYKYYFGVTDDYVSANNIETISFKKRDTVVNFINKIMSGSYSGDYGFLSKKTHLLKSEFEYVGSSDGIYLYLGEVDGDVPDGCGILVEKESNLGYMLRDAYIYGDFDSLLNIDFSDYEENKAGLIYAGYFKDGACDGYGMLFENVPSKCIAMYYGDSVDSSDDFYADTSYLVYEGEFEGSLKSGKGNMFDPPSEELFEYARGLDISFTSVLGVYVGEFKKDKMDGKGKIYSDKLLYDGEMKKGEPVND